MTFGRLWAGRLYGTNTGDLFLRLEGEDDALRGTLRVNDPTYGLTVFEVGGTFQSGLLDLKGTPTQKPDAIAVGNVDAKGKLDSKGEVRGEWQSDIGSAGTFVLFPHDQSSLERDSQPTTGAALLHSARENFGAIVIDKEQIVTLADALQEKFTNPVIVTFIEGTQRSLFLGEFRTMPLSGKRGELIRLYVQQPEASGLVRSVTVEFGQAFNFATTQGDDEAWVLGMLASVKRDVRPLERWYASSFWRSGGFGINQVLLVWVIALLPDLQDLYSRLALMAGLVAINLLVPWAHKKWVPFSLIYLGDRPTNKLVTFWPTAVSWVIAFSSGAAVLALSAILKGWFQIPI